MSAAAAGHKHDHGNDHDHDHDGSPGVLRIALGAAILVTLVEVAGGVASRSLALLADSAHVFMDVIAIGIALAAGAQALRPATARSTYGFARFEILAALLNGGLLFATTIAIAIEAVSRFVHPEKPEGTIMLAAAAFGVCVNVIVGIMLARSGHGDMNMRAVLLHVAGDALGGVAVIVAGVVILTTGIVWVDPLLSLVVAGIILAGVVRVVRDAAAVLLQSAPAEAPPEAIRAELGAIDGVRGVHDVHIWTLGSRKHVLTAHVRLEDKRISEATMILRDIEARMLREFSVTHVTIQFECENCVEDERIVCTQTARR